MQLRPYQEEAKQAIFDEWNKGINRTLLVLPTGCGKTIVFAKVTEEQVKQGDRVLILAHRFELLQQACDKIEQATGLKSAMEKAEYTCMGSWYRVVVGSVQTLMREKRLNGFANDFFDTIIVDAYEIIGLNQKSLINQGLDWLRPIFLTQKEAMKMSIRRFYEQRRKSAA